MSRICGHIKHEGGQEKAGNKSKESANQAPSSPRRRSPRFVNMKGQRRANMQDLSSANAFTNRFPSGKTDRHRWRAQSGTGQANSRCVRDGFLFLRLFHLSKRLDNTILLIHTSTTHVRSKKRTNPVGGASSPGPTKPHKSEQKSTPRGSMGSAESEEGPETRRAIGFDA